MDDSVFLSFPRLNILNQLSEVRQLNFANLKTKTGLTSGNLHSHCAKLLDFRYISKKKIQTDGTFQVYYAITPEGIQELSSYIIQLGQFLDRLQFKLKGTFEQIKYQLPPSILIEISDEEGNSFHLGEF